MRRNKGGGKRRNNSSPTRDRPLVSSPPPSSTLSPSAASVVDRELVTEENHLALFGNLQISSPDNNPRSFPYGVKQQCWEKAEKIKGRDPERWRRDFLGNTVFRKLVGCPGCLCHDYDHIIPYSKGLLGKPPTSSKRSNRASTDQGLPGEPSARSKMLLQSHMRLRQGQTSLGGYGWTGLVVGGKSTLDNCQVLQFRGRWNAELFASVSYRTPNSAAFEGHFVGRFCIGKLVRIVVETGKSINFRKAVDGMMRQQLIDQRGIGPRYPEQNLFKKVHTAGSQVVTWISLNCQPMAMSDEDQTLEDVIFSDALNGRGQQMGSGITGA
ncbi:HNH endonuclease [Actinidia rufa]|uniref:HNH endonuclease n=1 Tax=Actinidia rufa TaxID=165716 RepID=A0A7J0FY31_9ERIC|nr:HNH endonuclease [Actinidia rufa]